MRHFGEGLPAPGPFKPDAFGDFPAALEQHDVVPLGPPIDDRNEVEGAAPVMPRLPRLGGRLRFRVAVGAGDQHVNALGCTYLDEDFRLRFDDRMQGAEAAFDPLFDGEQQARRHMAADASQRGAEAYRLIQRLYGHEDAKADESAGENLADQFDDVESARMALLHAGVPIHHPPQRRTCQLQAAMLHSPNWSGLL
ncbi:hypothetical protein DFQ30_010009 [Apophysomyces sp. BC1015]|nr:hypothetical protein DFQ30_010009 [Apophysomyces sp. BC1015]